MGGTPATTQPFRFMDLPIEIRLMVYERLPRSIRHVNMASECLTAQLTLVTKSVDLAILRTCRQIHEEATEVVNKVVEKWILESDIQIATTTGESCIDLVDHVLRHSRKLASTLSVPKSREETLREAPVYMDFLLQLSYPRMSLSDDGTVPFYSFINKTAHQIAHRQKTWLDSQGSNSQYVIKLVIRGMPQGNNISLNEEACYQQTRIYMEVQHRYELPNAAYKIAGWVNNILSLEATIAPQTWGLTNVEYLDSQGITNQSIEVLKQMTQDEWEDRWLP